MIAFIKAHGLGNDCVIFQNCSEKLIETHAKFIANRKYGIGCDQVILINDNHVKFWNADGSYAPFCGNGCRCIALLLQNNNVSFQTDSGIVYAEKFDNNCIKIKYPKKPVILKQNFNEYYVDVGNKHIIIFSEEPKANWGSILKQYDSKNLNIMHLNYNNGWFMEIHERGVGETDSCGSGALAASVAILSKFNNQQSINIVMKGGSLLMSCDENGFFYQSGDAEISFAGEIDIN